MAVARLLFSILILLFTAYVVVMNWGCFIVNWRNKRRGIDRHHSMMPLVSVLFSYLAFLIYPYALRNWIGIIPLLDIGNWMLLLLPVILIREFWNYIRKSVFSRNC